MGCVVSQYCILKRRIGSYLFIEHYFFTHLKAYAQKRSKSQIISLLYHIRSHAIFVANSATMWLFLEYVFINSIVTLLPIYQRQCKLNKAKVKFYFSSKHLKAKILRSSNFLLHMTLKEKEAMSHFTVSEVKVSSQIKSCKRFIL